MRVIRHLVIGAAVLVASGAAAQQAKAPGLTALRSVEPGRWELHALGSKDGVRALCVRNGRQFIQLHHPRTRCSRLVVTNSADVATVHYTCPGAGFGRTTVKVESSKILAIETQGMAGGLPFEEQLEARRTGGC